MIGSAAPAERLDFQVIVQIAKEREHPHLGRSRDISLSGMLVAVPDDLNLGARVQIRVFLPGGGSPVALTGEVTRRAGASEFGNLFGVRFVDMTEEIGAALEKGLALRKRRLTNIS